MKFINKYIFPCVIAGSLMACDSQLDIEPQQSISEDLALSSSNNIRTVLNGAYDELGSSDVFGGNYIRNSELLAATSGNDAEILWQGTYAAPREMFNKRISTVNVDVSEAWLESYETINIANNVLASIDKVDADNQNTYEGEAKFVRALAYYGLVTLFAPQYEAGSASSALGVPLVLMPTRGVTDADKISRNTVAEVYNQIISDLQSAASLLPASNDIFATKGSANALLARVYLQQGDYQNALSAANTVINSGEYNLLGSYGANFANNNLTSEDIFIIQHTVQDDETDDIVAFFAPPSQGGRGDIPVLTPHLNMYEENDARFGFFYEADGDFWTGKWSDGVAQKVNILRLSEMHLIRAECNQRLGSSTGASPLADINAIRGRAGATTLSSVTLDDIMMERRLELAFEGHRIHDIRRTKGKVGDLNYDDPSLVYPIPQREIIANPNLVQNAGY